MLCYAMQCCAVILLWHTPSIPNRICTGVRARHLETVLPALGGVCVVLRGPLRGAEATLLAKDKQLGQALVQRMDSDSPDSYSLDDVAAVTIA